MEVNDAQGNIGMELCNRCGTKHTQNQCLLYMPYYKLNDYITYDDWKHNHTDSETNSKSATENYEDVKYTFAYSSLPKELCFEETNTTHGLGVFTKNTLKEFTEMGPLIGKVIKEVDIPEECNMRDLWEIVSTEKAHVYMNTADLDESNWIRFVRPAPTRELRNISAISKDNYLFLISIKPIKSGEELLYWQDDIVTNNKKKLEKISKKIFFICQS